MHSDKCSVDKMIYNLNYVEQIASPQQHQSFEIEIINLFASTRNWRAVSPNLKLILNNSSYI